jgi:hypothetical protein
MYQRFVFLATLLALAAVAGCGGGSKAAPITAPSIIAISPTSLPAGSAPFNLLVSGQALSTSSTVHFGGNLLSPSMTLPPVHTGKQRCHLR